VSRTGARSLPSGLLALLLGLAALATRREVSRRSARKPRA
jgi:hypothetical protein